MDTREETFETSAPITLRVTFGSGELTVIAEDTTRSTVAITPDRGNDKALSYVGDCAVELRGDELVVRAPDSRNWLKNPPSLHVQITVPTDSRLRATVASAEVRTHGRFGAADVTTASGDVELSEVTGELGVKTASGDVSTADVGGRAKLNTASGDVSLNRCTGDVSVNSASGDVSIADAHASVSAKTASGDVAVGRARAGNVNVNSASGDVHVGVASGVGVYLDLTSLSGDTASNLTEEGDAPTGGTDLQLTVRTLSGDINISRA